MFKRDFAAVGENQTYNFVAQDKLCLNAIGSLWVRIELAGKLNFVALDENQTRGWLQLYLDPPPSLDSYPPSPASSSAILRQISRQIPHN